MRLSGPVVALITTGTVCSFASQCQGSSTNSEKQSDDFLESDRVSAAEPSEGFVPCVWRADSRHSEEPTAWSSVPAGDSKSGAESASTSESVVAILTGAAGLFTIFLAGPGFGGEADPPAESENSDRGKDQDEDENENERNDNR